MKSLFLMNKYIQSEDCLTMCNWEGIVLTQLDAYYIKNNMSTYYHSYLSTIWISNVEETFTMEVPYNQHLMFLTINGTCGHYITTYTYGGQRQIYIDEELFQLDYTKISGYQYDTLIGDVILLKQEVGLLYCLYNYKTDTFSPLYVCIELFKNGFKVRTEDTLFGIHNFKNYSLILFIISLIWST